MASPSLREPKCNNRSAYSQRQVFDIPYFGHQQLDPNRFPPAVGAPLIKSPALIKLHEKRARNQVQSEEVIQAPADEDDSNDELPAGIDPEQPRKTTDVSPMIKIDPEDDLIVRLKEANYKDKAVAKHVGLQTQVTYHSKAIAARWARLKKTLGEHNDQLLDAGLTDWHDGDDQVLKQAIAAADRDVQETIRRAKVRKWHRVADHMKTLKPATNFSPRACQERDASLRDGTFKPTPESVRSIPMRSYWPRSSCERTEKLALRLTEPRGRRFSKQTPVKAISMTEIGILSSPIATYPRAVDVHQLEKSAVMSDPSLTQ